MKNYITMLRLIGFGGFKLKIIGILSVGLVIASSGIHSIAFASGEVKPGSAAAIEQKIRELRASPDAKSKVLPARTLSLTSESGGKIDVGFRSNPDIGSLERKFNVAIDGGIGELKPEITMKNGKFFEVKTENCSEKLSSAQTCEITVAMKGKVNGFFEDTLRIKVGTLKGEMSVKGEALGWPVGNLVWVGKSLTRDFSAPPEAPDLIWVRGGAEPELRVYRIKNVGGGASGPINLKATDRTGQGIRGWVVDVDPDCQESGLEPGEACDVYIGAVPESDGQTEAHLTLPDADHPGVPGKTVNIIAVVKGVAGSLPENVVGNGDPCPNVNERAEVAVSGSGSHRPGSGYYPPTDDPHSRLNDGTIEIVTAECASWQSQGDGGLYCVRTGQGGHHSSTLRRYQAKSINGPWNPTDLRPNYISATLTCKDGLIETIGWSW